MHGMSCVGRGKRIRGLGLVSFLALGLGQAATAAELGSVNYDIPAQNLGAALKTFAQQSNIQVMFAPEAVQGLEAPAVQGNYRPDAALDQLLQRANLDYRYVGDQMVVVSANGAMPAPQDIQENRSSPEPVAAPASDSARESRNNIGFQIDEIVVTASKRSLRLQEVPMAVSALDATRLDRMGAQAFNDYLRSVPGVSFIDRGPGRNKIIIRGISDGPNSGTESTTGIYIDETPVTEPLQTADLNMFDVERVEVLRGPQGTLYGAGSMGGTVRIILNKPDATAFGAAADATLSTTRRGGENYALNAMVNLPIIEDRLALRVVGHYREEGGFIDDIARNVKDVNDTTIKGGRAMLHFTPDENLRILASVTYQDTETGALPAEDLATGNYQQARLFPENGANDWYLYSLQVDYELSDVQLTSVTSYFEKDTLARLDYSAFLSGQIGLPEDTVLGLDNNYRKKSFTQEVRLASSGDSRLQWLLGAFYQHDRMVFNQFGDTSHIPALGGVPLIEAEVRSNLEQIALFGELSYNITDRLQATAGMRWFKVDQENLTEAFGLLYGPPEVTPGTASDKSESLKFLLSYEISDDNMIYVQAAQGFRVGGPTGPIPEDACAADLAFFGYDRAPTEYKSDSLWSYELGSKNSFLDNRLTFNAAGYYIDWTDIQVQRVLPNCGFNFIANAGAASSKGVEVELAARPFEGFEITSSVAYTKTRIKATIETVGAIEGDPLPNVPEWTANFTAQYSFPVFSGLLAYVRGEVQHVDGSLNDFSGLPAGFSVSQPSYQIGGLRIGLQDETWEAAFFVHNIWDERAQTYTQVGFVNPSRMINQPRTIGIHAKARF